MRQILTGFQGLHLNKNDTEITVQIEKRGSILRGTFKFFKIYKQIYFRYTQCIPEEQFLK